MTDERRQTESSDERLVRAALAGDLVAFGTLVERYWNMAFALALSRMSDPQEAEDVAQESFLKAYSQLSALRDPSRFAGWVSKITQQQCSDALRKRLRCRTALGSQTTSAGQLEAMPAYSSNPGLTETQMQFVRMTVGQLPERFRNLIIMRFMGGLSAVQIAEQLGKRPGTVRVWLHRAYKILRKDLAPLLEEVES
ncbi:MAG: sigma-70 family RNA polymerase sigma factor [Sedimentisphaerales bacterium]|nr:sigma-70 family RNA polymerase sigma factor [Sedimentisphaerales bacterium]